MPQSMADPVKLNQTIRWIYLLEMPIAFFQVGLPQPLFDQLFNLANQRAFP
jgi:hypothetical protein